MLFRDTDNHLAFTPAALYFDSARHETSQQSAALTAQGIAPVGWCFRLILFVSFQHLCPACAPTSPIHDKNKRARLTLTVMPGSRFRTFGRY